MISSIRRSSIQAALCFVSAVASPLAAQGTPATLVVESPAYKSAEAIPATYTVDGRSISPPLTWKGAPASTKEFAVILEDVSNGAVHWTIYKIPATATGLPEAVPAATVLPASAGAIAGAMQGPAGGGGGGRGGRGGAPGGAAPPGAPPAAPPPAPAPAYRPPAPPAGAPHNYRFTVYAVDMPLDVMPGLSKPALVTAMTGHIVAQGELTASYTRRAP